MKTTTLFLAAALTAVPLVKAAAAKPKIADQPQRVSVVYVDPAKFTDVRDSYTGTDSGRDDILDRIREYVQDEAKQYIPEGDKLFISVTDIDLAGDYEPWRGPRWDDIRIVKDIYPPRIVFSFRLTDPSGKVIKEGDRDLRDMAFLMKITMAFQDDPLRHEKQLLDDWFRDEFRGMAKR
jgi:hypothetical protein